MGLVLDTELHHSESPSTKLLPPSPRDNGRQAENLSTEKKPTLTYKYLNQPAPPYHIGCFYEVSGFHTSLLRNSGTDVLMPPNENFKRAEVFQLSWSQSSEGLRFRNNIGFLYSVF